MQQLKDFIVKYKRYIGAAVIFVVLVLILVNCTGQKNGNSDTQAGTEISGTQATEYQLEGKYFSAISFVLSSEPVSTIIISSAISCTDSRHLPSTRSSFFTIMQRLIVTICVLSAYKTEDLLLCSHDTLCNLQ